MNLTSQISETDKNIRYVFSAIKKDNVKKFSELIEKDLSLIDFKNNKKENLLFYAFENNSKQIIDLILKKRPMFLMEKNILNINIIHELINKNKDIDCFLDKISKLDVIDKQYLFTNHDPQGNNIFILAAKSGNNEYLKKLIKIYPNFKDINNKSNIYGQNIAHFMATKIFEKNDTLINGFSSDTLSKLDNINGFSPVMLAAYYQNLENFTSYYKIYPNNQKSSLGNELIHFAAHNNKDIILFLIKNGLFSNKKNDYNQTPLFISLLKGKVDIAIELFEEAKKDKIYQEDILISTKIMNKNYDFFETIINNKTNEKLTLNNQKKFLEYLFLYCSYDQLIKTINNPNIIDYIKNLDFSILSSKTITGKKDMVLKINYLLKHKEVITTEESLSISQSLDKLPKNQISFILKNSNLLSKINNEDKPVFFALALKHELKNIEISDNLIIKNELMGNIKFFLKTTNINNEKHLLNISNWLKLFQDKNIIYKHYGMIASKNNNPFNFIQENFKDLDKDNKKNLIFYTLTALFKYDNNNISEETYLLISKHKNLLLEVFCGIIKFGKIPLNKKLINILHENKDKLINQENLLVFFQKSNKNNKLAINFLKNNLNIFDLKKINNIRNFCDKLILEPYHTEIFDLIVNKIENKKEFISNYIDSYLNNYVSINKNNNKFFLNLIKNYPEKNNIIKVFILNNIKNKNFIEIGFLKELNKKTILNHTEINTFYQELVNNLNFTGALKFQEIFIKEININNLNFIHLKDTNLNFESNDFLDFLIKNSKKLNKKQLFEINSVITNKIKKDEISLSDIEKYMVSFSNSIDKLDSNFIINISNYILNKQSPKDLFLTSILQESLNNIFSVIYLHKDINVFKNIESHKNYHLISNNIKISIEKKLLENELNSNFAINKSKVNKI